MRFFAAALLLAFAATGPSPASGAESFRLVGPGESAPADASPLRKLPAGVLYEVPAPGGGAPASAAPRYLLRAFHGARPGLSSSPAAWGAARGVRVLWTDGEFLLVESGDPAAVEAITAEGFELETLEASGGRRTPRPESALGPGEPPRGLTTTFEALVDTIVARVQPDSIHQRVGRLSGVESLTVGGVPYLFRTRYTHVDAGRKAEQACFEAFAAMGLQVEYESVPVNATSARNVIATLPGRVTPERIYVIGGHLDSTSPQASTHAPGAEDNASGTAGVLEAARVLKDYDFNSTIRFIAFTGEEQGLFGSTRNAANAAARGDSIFGVVAMDMIGWIGNTYKLTIEGETEWDSIMTVMADACARYTPLQTQKTFFSFGSDHVPYQNNGYAAFLAIEDEYEDYPGYHQESDSLSFVSAAQCGDVVRAAVATIAHLAHPVELAIAHDPLPSTADTTGPYVVHASVFSPDGVVPGSVQLHWSDGGPITVLAMTPTGPPDEYGASIPGHPSGSWIYYAITASDSAGRSAGSPPNAPGAFHVFSIGSLQLFYTQGFESGGDDGWVHGATLGSDDWQRATPGALGGDPGAAATGTRSWGNDLTGLGANAGKYESNSRTFLRSPAIDCSVRSGVHLSFKRWLGVERNNNLQWDIASVIVNADTVWRNPSGTNLIDAAWQDQSFDISAIADGNPAVTVTFALKSDGSTVFCGWNVDDVQLAGIGAASPTGLPGGGAAAATLSLGPASPNPSRLGARIPFSLPATGAARLAVYDVTGRRVALLVDGRLPAGPHAVTWDGRTDSGDRAPSGVYFLRLEHAGSHSSSRLTLLR